MIHTVYAAFKNPLDEVISANIGFGCALMPSYLRKHPPMFSVFGYSLIILKTLISMLRCV